MDKEQKVNSQITHKTTNLVTPDGNFFTAISLQEAFEKADQFGLDLVEVSPGNDGGLPVCKIVDYGKLKYKKNKSKKHIKKEVIKDIKFGINISDHDLEVKNKKVKDLISKGNKIRYTLELKGREVAKVDVAVNKVKDNLVQFSSVANCTEVKKNGRFVTSLITSLEK